MLLIEIMSAVISTVLYAHFFLAQQVSVLQNDTYTLCLDFGLYGGGLWIFDAVRMEKASLFSHLSLGLLFYAYSHCFFFQFISSVHFLFFVDV